MDDLTSRLGAVSLGSPADGRGRQSAIFSEETRAESSSLSILDGEEGSARDRLSPFLTPSASVVHKHIAPSSSVDEHLAKCMTNVKAEYVLMLQDAAYERYGADVEQVDDDGRPITAVTGVWATSQLGFGSFSVDHSKKKVALDELHQHVIVFGSRLHISLYNSKKQWLRMLEGVHLAVPHRRPLPVAHL